MNLYISESQQVIILTAIEQRLVSKNTINIRNQSTVMPMIKRNGVNKLRAKINGTSYY